jgi:hypothetical protein
VEFWQGFQLLLRRARQRDSPAISTDLQRRIGHGNEPAANAEEAAYTFIKLSYVTT